MIFLMNITIRHIDTIVRNESIPIKTRYEFPSELVMEEFELSLLLIIVSNMLNGTIRLLNLDSFE